MAENWSFRLAKPADRSDPNGAKEEEQCTSKTSWLPWSPLRNPFLITRTLLGL